MDIQIPGATVEFPGISYLVCAVLYMTAPHIIPILLFGFVYVYMDVHVDVCVCRYVYVCLCIYVCLCTCAWEQGLSTDAT